MVPAAALPAASRAVAAIRPATWVRRDTRFLPELLICATPAHSVGWWRRTQPPGNPGARCPAVGMLARAAQRQAAETEDHTRNAQDQPGRQGQQILDRLPDGRTDALLDQRLKAHQAVAVDLEPQPAEADHRMRPLKQQDDLGERRRG